MLRFSGNTLNLILRLLSLHASFTLGLEDSRESLDLIVGGEPAGKNELPYQISLRRSGAHDCGGSILNSQYILTAAHCVSHGDAGIDDYEVVAGEHDVSKNDEGTEQVRKLNQILPHPEYSISTRANDIAILRLASPLNLNSAVQPIKLPQPGHTATGEALVSGWGLLGDGSLPAVLQKVRVPIITDEKCREAYGTTQITDNMICAGVEEGGKDSCTGDSGGPIIAYDDGAYLAGVVSWGAGCGLPGYPGVYTEVSHFITWIQDNTP